MAVETWFQCRNCKNNLTNICLKDNDKWPEARGCADYHYEHQGGYPAITTVVTPPIKGRYDVFSSTDKEKKVRTAFFH